MSGTERSHLLRGTGVSGGVCRGPALRYENEAVSAPRERCADPAAELEKAAAAWAAVEADLQRCYEEASGRAGKEADIFLAHLLLLTDESSLLEPVRALIAEEGWTAAWAAQSRFDGLVAKMAAGGDAYLRERAADLEDLKDQVLRRLLNRPRTDIGALPGDVVLVARDLAPSDTIRMDLTHIKGVVCEEGGTTSHTALLARSMGIPAVMGCTGVLDRAENGQILLLDGGTGEVRLSPSAEEAEAMERRAGELEAERQALEAFRGLPACTREGRRVHICANIARPEECARAVAGDCEGIGLFRSEFLYLGRDTLPGEEEQYEAYAAALRAAEGRSVTIRTLDVGGDKELPSLGREPEANPFLGHRAIRLCLEERPLFLTQLRALYRAGVHGELRIMFPMISTLEELRGAKALAAEARRQLAEEGTPFREDVPLGMMVEVPAAAVMAEAFAREADFFSIGTNDLIQYTMAADRGNPKVAGLYTPFQPAVLRLLKQIIGAAAQAGIECCVCGGAGEDPDFLPLLVAMGLPSVSVSPPNILRLRGLVRGLSEADLQRALEAALRGETAPEVRGAVRP